MADADGKMAVKSAVASAGSASFVAAGVLSYYKTMPLIDEANIDQAKLDAFIKIARYDWMHHIHNSVTQAIQN